MAHITWHREGDYCSGIDSETPPSDAAVGHHLQANGVHCSWQGTRVSFGGHSKFVEVIALSMPFVGTKLVSPPAAPC